MRFRRTIAASIAICLLTIVPSGCSFPFFKQPQAQNILPPTNEIAIGVSEPTTGASAVGGQLAWEGIELANALHPEALGKKIRLYLVDNKSDATEAAAVVTRLASQDQVAAIIGTYGSTLAVQGAKQAKLSGVPVIGDSPTGTAVTADNDYSFRVCFTDAFQGAVMARYASETMRAQTVGIITNSDSDYSTGLAASFKAEFSRLGGTVAAEATHKTGAQDFATELQPVVAAWPDIIFAPGEYGESALLIKQLRTAGYWRPILGGDTWDTPDFITIAGHDAEGVTFCSQFSVDSPQTAAATTFINEYGKRYVGKQPTAATALAYDAYMVLLDALNRAGSADPRAIRDALAATSGFEGATGVITMGATRDPGKPALIRQIKNGAAGTVSVVQPQ